MSAAMLALVLLVAVPVAGGVLLRIFWDPETDDVDEVR